jgi:hypothetical protein
MKTRTWDIYEFTKPQSYKHLGNVDAPHQPGAWKAASLRWPALAAANHPDYPNGRLITRLKGDTRGMPGFKQAARQEYSSLRPSAGYVSVPVNTGLHNSPHQMATCSSPDCMDLTGRSARQ